MMLDVETLFAKEIESHMIFGVSFSNLLRLMIKKR